MIIFIIVIAATRQPLLVIGLPQILSLKPVPVSHPLASRDFYQVIGPASSLPKERLPVCGCHSRSFESHCYWFSLIVYTASNVVAHCHLSLSILRAMFFFILMIITNSIKLLTEPLHTHSNSLRAFSPVKHFSLNL